MVYRGPPAKGCERCRKRRIRCDLIEAGCGNCKRAGATCSGYRKHIDLMFCDQTFDIAKKVTNRGTPSANRRSSKDSDSSEKEAKLPAIGQELSWVSIDDFALGYCREHHLVRLPGSNICLESVDEKLLYCLKALGAASYSTTMQSPQLGAQGRKYYVSAIQLLNRDLALPDEAVKDTALLTVITLSYYESVSGSTWRSFTTWSQHIQGIAALLELRGPEQLKTQEGRLLFHQATSCLVFDCLRMSMRLPFCIHDLIRVLARDIENPNDPPWRVHLALVDLVELKADLYENLANDARDTTYRLLKIEEDLQSAFLGVSAVWRYEVEQWSCKLFSSCLPDHYHVYESALSAQLRNAARNARIVCHRLIACVLKLGAAEMSMDYTGELLAKSYNAMQQLQTEILASVPQYLGLENAPSFETYCPSVDNDGPHCPTKDLYQVAKTSSTLPVLRTPHHYIFLWNLLMAGEVSVHGGAQRKAICELLIYAGKSVGMAQAFVFAEALEQNRDAAAALGVRTELNECLAGGPASSCFGSSRSE